MTELISIKDPSLTVNFPATVKFESAIVNDQWWCRIDKEIYYFTASKELLEKIFPGKYPEAIGMTIRLEKHIDDNSVIAAISPYRNSVDGDSVIDYDWTHVDITTKDIEWLFSLYERRKIND